MSTSVQGQPAIEEEEQEQVDDAVLQAFLERGYQRWEDLQVRIRAMDAEEGARFRRTFCHVGSSVQGARAAIVVGVGSGAWPPLFLWDGKNFKEARKSLRGCGDCGPCGLMGAPGGLWGKGVRRFCLRSVFGVIAANAHGRASYEQGLLCVCVCAHHDKCLSFCLRAEEEERRREVALRRFGHQVVLPILPAAASVAQPVHTQ